MNRNAALLAMLTAGAAIAAGCGSSEFSSSDDAGAIDGMSGIGGMSGTGGMSAGAPGAGGNIGIGDAGGSGGTAANYEATVLSDGPSLYWRELAGTGSVADVSRKGHDGNYAGCVEAGPMSAPPSIRLCGGYVQAGDIFDFAGTAQFTFEAWIRPEGPQLSRFARIAGKEDPVPGPRQGWDLIAVDWDTDGGTPTLSFERWSQGDASEGGSGAVLNDPTISSASFTYVAITYDSTTCRIYVNGVSVAEGLSTASIADTESTFRVGADPFGGSNWLGEIAEIAVYEKALLPERVAAHYDQGKAEGY